MMNSEERLKRHYRLGAKKLSYGEFELVVWGMLEPTSDKQHLRLFCSGLSMI